MLLYSSQRMSEMIFSIRECFFFLKDWKMSIMYMCAVDRKSTNYHLFIIYPVLSLSFSGPRALKSLKTILRSKSKARLKITKTRLKPRCFQAYVQSSSSVVVNLRPTCWVSKRFLSCCARSKDWWSWEKFIVERNSATFLHWGIYPTP